VSEDPRNTVRHDAELEEFRDLMHPPSTFVDGFTWPAFFGAIFVALMMVPGTMYMSMVAGSDSMDDASRWVTVILFIEVARRANKNLKNAELFTIFWLTTAAMAGPFEGFLFRQYFVQSPAVYAHGIVDGLPEWWAPTSPEVLERHTLFQKEWLVPIGMVFFFTFMSRLDNMILGYGMFRLASDIEKLPFPMAPVGAQGILALSEEQEEEQGAQTLSQDADEAAEERPDSWRWRIFSIGSVMGLVFGALYLALPTITGGLTGQPIQLLPIPFLDTTPDTQDFLPAVATAISFDMTFFLVGMVLPFYAVMGQLFGLLVTFVLNPLLYLAPGGYWEPMLTSYKPGNGMLETVFRNHVDFYFSFTIGIMIAIAAVGLYESIRGIRMIKSYRQSLSEEERDRDEGRVYAAPEGRGDIRATWIIGFYFISTFIYIGMSMWLLWWADGGWKSSHLNIIFILLFYGFVYTPMISYATARLEGIAGRTVSIPMVREASFILSGYQGVAIWFLPIPMDNYGDETKFYRTMELTGTKFWSIWKAQIILTPIILASSLFFANFIWSLGEIPGSQYPYAQEMWPFQAENRAFIYTATLGGFTIFEESLKPWVIVSGFGIASTAFAVMSLMQWPIFFIFGAVQGLGQTTPHAVIPQVIGALIGRYYFQKKYGKAWRQYIPVLLAGFSCGMGLTATFTMGITFLINSVFQVPL